MEKFLFGLGDDRNAVDVSVIGCIFIDDLEIALVGKTIEEDKCVIWLYSQGSQDDVRFGAALFIADS